MSHPSLNAIFERCTEEGDCWLWQDGVNGAGWPSISIGGRTQYVRRVVRGMMDGEPVPARMRVPAKCGQRLCVSPYCSIVCTHRTSHRMAAERGAFGRPDAILRTTLRQRAQSAYSDELVSQIRTSEEDTATVCQRTGMSSSHVRRIRSGEARRDLSNPLNGLGARA
ncbi:hypothetical protein [Pseudorhodoferax sp. Leaf274]|uniref:hypothetical protein n=1 Tax=Pseudorhodoferax sp. Leaf274 TaxID=1736318 RepID=UPI00070278AA|nr:hypothetical protein [Pseudorhodoferax sp. Leaf274]KQP37582.1 hypothetical protein ASF44_14665 [Pseudorhodoferax sp. Leaf274]